MTTKAHWEQVYSTKASDQVSWYQAHPARSLALIRATGIERSAPILDIGAGASLLVDALLDDGYANLAVLDVSANALAIAKGRLGERAALVRWIEADILSASLAPASCALWHDRAAFHFLTAAGDRRRYADAARRAIAPGGHLIVATFADDGPERCSGLAVVRYGADALATEFGDGFEPVRSENEQHATPSGATQSFLYAWLRRTGDAA